MKGIPFLSVQTHFFRLKNEDDGSKPFIPVLNGLFGYLSKVHFVAFED